MTVPRLAAVVLILLAASLGWTLLSQSVTLRTASAGDSLGGDVARMFGPPIAQGAPKFIATGGAERPPDASEIRVTLDHEHRSRGLVWFSVFRVAFDATYTLGPVADAPPEGRFVMDLPKGAAIDGLEVVVGDRQVPIDRTHIDLKVPLHADRGTEVRVKYATAGRDAWAYLPLSAEGGLRRFRLSTLTNFTDIDYPATGLSPTTKAATRPDGRPGLEAVWAYEQMLPGQNQSIGVVMPSLPSAGALSARISSFAPVSLFFFFVVMVTIQVLKGWRLHPMNYLLIAAGFFAFHILLAYLVDHLAIHASFWISAAVSTALVLSYLRLVLGSRRAVLLAGAAQLVYLVFFSYAFFWHGWTGLTVVIGAILTLFLLMQVTGRIDWAARLSGAAPAAPPAPAEA
ncbi:MAG TPA: inner membrane CreD family protein [Planctomycetota bacterium]|nr:inner membrane CreD family protein [Planctomycetota bacterium]